MRMEDMVIASIDDHIVEPPDMFEQHLPKEIEQPRIVENDAGHEIWMWDDIVAINIGLNAVVGRPKDEWGMEPARFDHLRRAAYDVDARVDDMNVNGVFASLCFGTFVKFDGKLFTERAKKDPKNAYRVLQAYNDWHIDEWCGTYPGRFIPLALPVMWDAKLAADEVRRVAKKGCYAVSFTENPEKLGFPSLHDEFWEPLWEACVDEGVVVAIHIGSASGMSFTTMDSPVDVMITNSPMSISVCAADLVWSQILRKYPTLKFALSEGGIGWIPYFLHRIDYVFKHHHKWTNQDFGGKLPSDIFREHIITCFIDDPVGVRNRHAIGIDTITWECDYPHSDTTWPRAPEILWESLDGVPDAEINKMTHENALRVFQLDAFSQRPKAKCTAAALRAESPDVDLGLRRQQGGKPPRDAGAGIITTQDVTSQLASAFAAPAE